MSVSCQFLILPRGSRPAHGPFAAGVLTGPARSLLGLGPGRLRLHVTAFPPPRLALVPFRRGPVALLSADLDPGALPDALSALRRGPYAIRGYRVQRSTPVESGHPAGSSAPTPGAGLLTLLRRRPGLPTDRFLEAWHHGHTYLSLQIHPLWHYERNVVGEVLTPGAPAWDGIVTEHFRSPEDLLRPLRLFGGPLHALPNMARVARDIAGFLHLPSLETYLVEEHRLR